VASLDPWKWGNCHECQAACHGSDWQTHGDWSTTFYLETLLILHLLMASFINLQWSQTDAIRLGLNAFSVSDMTA